jgi:predicted Fe-S protein YdhL (DUF1289 family)
MTTLTMADIETPCTKICSVDPASALCIGCGRSLAEIGRWTEFSDDERHRIMNELPWRMSLLRRGQAERLDGR